MGRLDGKTAIVTGAASGIGRASALRLAGEGARVVVMDREGDALHAAWRSILDAGGEAVAVEADAGTEDGVARTFEACLDAFGRLDVLFANAGISGGNVPFLEQTVAQWNEVLRVNVVGVFLAVQAAAAHMSTHGGGSIICNASVAGLRARAGSSPYSASKAGVISLVQTAASQLQGTRVRVNAVCPGLIDTDMTRGVFDRARERGVLEDVERLGALHRRGLPDEVAGTVLFLASEDSSFVNGQAIAVCGGFSSTHPFVGMGTPLRTVKDG